MSNDADTALAALALLISVLSAWWGWRADRRADATHGLVVRTNAVADLTDGLHRLRRLARQADVAPLIAEGVTDAMVDFEDRVQRHQAVLPAHLQIVGREVRAAMGNCFGSPALVGLDARLAEGELSTFDHYWWEITRSYLEHVNTCLQDWRTAPTRRRPTELTYFHAWRKGEDATYFAQA